MRTQWMAALFAFALLAIPAVAGDQVEVRLVAILPGSSADSSGVGDILPLLRKNLGENRYEVAAQEVIPLPADQQKVSLVNVFLVCSGDQANLQIVVSNQRSKGKPLINTNVSLEDGKPFLLGGTGKKEKFVLVFVAR